MTPRLRDRGRRPVRASVATTREAAEGIPRRTRTLSVLALLITLVTGAGAASSVALTESAWTDKTYATAVATGGTWSKSPTLGCVAMNANGTPRAGGHCTITSVTVGAQWGDPGNRTRNYTLRFDTNAADGYIQFTVNLAAGTGAFSWGNAGLVAPSQQVTPDNAWSCSQLPILSGKTPTNWGWGANSSIFFQIAENRRSASTVCQ